MICIRLQRIGKPKQPTYRFVVSEKHKDTQGKSVEILGQYNPVLKEKVLTLNLERVNYWLGQGAQCSNTVHNLFVKEGIVEAKKRRSVHISDKRSAKLTAKKAEAEEKAAAEKAKKAEAEAAAKAAAEAEKAAAQAAAAEPEPEEAPADAATEATEEKSE